MDKEWWKTFLRWLDQSSPEELERRKSELLEFSRKKLDDPDVKADAKRMIRLIDQELLAHASVSRRSSGKR